MIWITSMEYCSGEREQKIFIYILISLMIAILPVKMEMEGDIFVFEQISKK